jgi:hypothetical protein
MRRHTLTILLMFYLQACSSIPFFARTNTPAPSATSTETFTPTATSTPTITPTITPSVTIVHIPTYDPNEPTATFIPIPVIENIATPFVYAGATIANPGPGFLSVEVTPNKIYWGACKNNKATITATVMDREEVLSVVIFVRVKSAKKEDYTPWTNGDVMSDHRDGTYTYILRGINIEGHNHYRDSWVYFQLVATNRKGEEVGRTQIYTNSIALSPCM